MNRMFLIFSHRLTEDQIRDARNNLNIEEFIYLPNRLQNIWSSIPPESDMIDDILRDIKDWVCEISSRGDYVLIQGDFGATYIMVNYCKDLGLKTIYSTAKRQVKEFERDDEKIESISIFRHIRFREYE